MKALLKDLDARFFGGRLRRWAGSNLVLGGSWGTFIEALEGLPAESVVLDLGAGEAELRTRLNVKHYIAVDRGVGHGGWDYSRLDAVADALAVPIAGDSVDVIVCKQVLEHVPDPIALLREAARILKPGGRILLSTNQAWPQHQKPYDFFRFTGFGLTHCFESAGFAIESMEPMGGGILRGAVPLLPDVRPRHLVALRARTTDRDDHLQTRGMAHEAGDAVGHRA